MDAGGAVTAEWTFQNAPRSRAGLACTACGWIHTPSDVQHVNKFGLRPPDLFPYRASDGTRHPTREAAQEWLCQQRQIT